MQFSTFSLNEISWKVLTENVALALYYFEVVAMLD